MFGLVVRVDLAVLDYVAGLYPRRYLPPCAVGGGRYVAEVSAAEGTVLLQGTAPFATISYS